MLNHMWLTEAQTGKKTYLDFSRIRDDKVTRGGVTIPAVYYAHCDASDYGIFKKPIIKNSKETPDAIIKDDSCDMIQVRLKGVEKPMFFLCSLDEFNAARESQIENIHMNQRLVQRMRRLIDRVVAISHSGSKTVLHVPKYFGTDRAVLFDHPDFFTFPSTAGAITQILGRAPLASLDPTPEALMILPSQIAAAPPHRKPVADFQQ